jgi:hypothetical protein
MLTLETVGPPPRDRAAGGPISKRYGGGFDQKHSESASARQVNAPGLFKTDATRVKLTATCVDWHDERDLWSACCSPILADRDQNPSSDAHLEDPAGLQGSPLSAASGSCRTIGAPELSTEACRSPLPVPPSLCRHPPQHEQ